MLFFPFTENTNIPYENFFLFTQKAGRLHLRSPGLFSLYGIYNLHDYDFP